MNNKVAGVTFFANFILPPLQIVFPILMLIGFHFASFFGTLDQTLVSFYPI